MQLRDAIKEALKSVDYEIDKNWLQGTLTAIHEEFPYLEKANYVIDTPESKPVSSIRIVFFLKPLFGGLILHSLDGEGLSIELEGIDYYGYSIVYNSDKKEYRCLETGYQSGSLQGILLHLDMELSLEDNQ